MSRILDFSDGFTSSTEPLQGIINTTSLTSFINDAAYVSNKGSAATQGDLYLRTSDNQVRFYNGTDWVTVVSQDASGNVVVEGNLTVNGTTVTLNTATLDVEDKNITLNKGGNNTSSEGAGLTIERESNNGSLVYDSSKASKFKLGEQGSELEVADISSTQTLTNKTIDAASNTLSNIVNANISASAAIARTKLATLTASRAMVTDGSGNDSVSAVTATELGYVNGVTSAIQTQLDAKIAKSLTSNTGDMIYASSASTPARLPIGTDGYTLSVVSGLPTWTAPAAAPVSSLEISNLGLAVSVAANAMTISLKQANGSTNPNTGSSAVKIGFRSSTLTSGAFNQRSVTSATSLVVSSGSTLGMVNGAKTYLWIYALDNAGTVELAISQKVFLDSELVSTTAEGGAGAADSATVMYSTTARTSVPFRLIGKIITTQTTAGTWTATPTTIAVGDYNSLQENVIVSFGSTAGCSIGGSYTLQTFTASEIDTHGCWNGTDTFTPSISGVYSIAPGILTAAVTLSTIQAVTLVVFKNGVAYRVLDKRNGTGASTTYLLTGSDLIRVNAGETLQIYASGSVATSQSTSGGYNKVTITKVGN